MPKITTTEQGYILETNFTIVANVFLLFDKNGNVLDKSTDYDFLHKKLVAMQPKQQQDSNAPLLFYYRGAMFISN